MKKKESLLGIKDYIKDLFRSRYDSNFQFYNIEHTQQLVSEVIYLTKKNDELNKQESFNLLIAAWFFDIAQLELWQQPHKDVRSLRHLILDSGAEEPAVEQIIKLLPPNYPAKDPVTFSEKILSDAIRFYWSTSSFDFWVEALRQDTQVIENRTISMVEWLEHLVIYMQDYDFYARKNNVERTLFKVKNLQNTKRQIKRMSGHVKSEHADSKGLAKIDNSDKSDKGVETMFKITSTNNQRLTNLADNKSHILITVNSIILSAILSILLRKLEDNSYLIYPTFLLLGVSLASMIFAILATRPNIPDGRFTNRKLKDQSSNLLFFGNFYRMSLSEYTDGMLRMMYDKKLIYHSLIMDIYGQGIVLGKKYVLLRIAYNIFMFGLIVSVIAFLIFFFIHQTTLPASTVQK